MDRFTALPQVLAVQHQPRDGVRPAQRREPPLLRAAPGPGLQPAARGGRLCGGGDGQAGRSLHVRPGGGLIGEVVQSRRRPLLGPSPG